MHWDLAVSNYFGNNNIDYNNKCMFPCSCSGVHSDSSFSLCSSLCWRQCDLHLYNWQSNIAMEGWQWNTNPSQQLCRIVYSLCIHYHQRHNNCVYSHYNYECHAYDQQSLFTIKCALYELEFTTLTVSVSGKGLCKWHFIYIWYTGPLSEVANLTGGRTVVSTTSRPLCKELCCIVEEHWWLIELPPTPDCYLL